MKQKPKLLWKICMLMAVLIMAVGYIQCGDDEGKLAKDCVDVDEDKHGEGSDCEGLDCDDNNPTIYASAQEVCGNGIDEDCDGQDTSCMADCQDGDGDLYGEGTGCKGPDCDDSNANVNPLAIEICGDSIDNDCNGEDAPCCNDKDGDGYGAGESCQENDCDDTNPNVYPGAPEICDDNLDQNCDGKDIKCSEVCLDLDSDGFGEGLGCKDKDCNDQDPAINPDAKEVCGNAVDENCDTKMDECLDCNDQDGDGYGIGADCLGTDCDDNNKDINPSAQEICGNSIDED